MKFKKFALLFAVCCPFLIGCNSGGDTPTPPAPGSGYLIKWIDGDNKTIKTDTVAKGVTPSYSGPNPTKRQTDKFRYTWDGTWSPAIEPATKDAEYKAQFTPEQYAFTIIFKDWDGKELSKKTLTKGSTPYCAQPSRKSDERYDYTFKSWEPTVEKVSKDQTYIATYNPTAHSYLVTYRNYNNAILKEKYTKIGDSYFYDGDAPVGQTYTDDYVDVFDGWNKTIEPVSNSDQSYTATYKKEALTQTSFVIAHDGTNTYIEFEVENNYEKYTVDWGDDDTEQPTEFTSKATHTYASTTAQNYTVKISKSKKMSSFKFTDTLGKKGFQKVKSITLSNSIRTLPREALKNCIGIDQKLTIPNSVSIIGENAVYGCDNIPSIKAPDHTISIGNSAFASCDNLSEIDLGGTISVGNSIISGSVITALNIPKTLISMTDTSFVYCDTIQTISVNNENPKYDSRDNCNAIIEKASNTLIRGSLTTVIPNSIKIIGAHSFSYYDTLASVTIPEGVEQIGNYAFSGCETLATVSLPSTLLSIGDRAFYDCSLLKNITFSNTLTSIGQYAFYDCSDDLSVTMTALDHVIKGSSYMFYKYNGSGDSILPNLNITVKANMYEAYCTADRWGTYKNHITAV